MKSLVVGIFGDKNLGKELAKKGTESDITLYNLKKDEKILSFVEPTRYPEKIQSLSYAINMADYVVLKISVIDKTFAETVVALDAFGMEKGCIIFGEGIAKDHIGAYLSGTVLENYETVENDLVKLREMLFEINPEHKEGAVKIPIDHHFNVKGVGPVVLGLVKRGTVKKHDELVVYPLEKKVIVRSIQKQDKDYDDADVGARVGLALKNIDAEELDRGFVLAPEGTLKTGMELKLKFKVNRYWKNVFQPGQVHHLGIGMQFFPAKILDIENNGKSEIKASETGLITFKTEKKVVFEKDEKAMIFKPEGEGLRVAGCGIII